MRQQNKLDTIDGRTLMDRPLEPPNFVVDTLLSQGLHILVGSPKVGKSWLALWLAVTVAKGEPVWGMSVKRGKMCIRDRYSCMRCPLPSPSRYRRCCWRGPIYGPDRSPDRIQRSDTPRHPPRSARRAGWNGRTRRTPSRWGQTMWSYPLLAPALCRPAPGSHGTPHLHILEKRPVPRPGIRYGSLSEQRPKSRP